MFLLWSYFVSRTPHFLAIIRFLSDINGVVFVIQQPSFFHITNFFKSLKEKVEPIFKEIQVSPNVHCNNIYLSKTHFNFILLFAILVWSSSLLESITFYKALHLSRFESLHANRAISVEAKFCLKRSFLAFRMLKRSWLCLVVIKALPSSSLLFFIATKWCLVILECFLPLPVLY